MDLTDPRQAGRDAAEALARVGRRHLGGARGPQALHLLEDHVLGRRRPQRAAGRDDRPGGAGGGVAAGGRRDQGEHPHRRRRLAWGGGCSTTTPTLWTPHCCSRRCFGSCRRTTRGSRRRCWPSRTSGCRTWLHVEGERRALGPLTLFARTQCGNSLVDHVEPFSGDSGPAATHRAPAVTVGTPRETGLPGKRLPDLRHGPKGDAALASAVSKTCDGRLLPTPTGTVGMPNCRQSRSKWSCLASPPCRPVPRAPLKALSWTPRHVEHHSGFIPCRHSSLMSQNLPPRQERQSGRRARSLLRACTPSNQLE